MASFYYSKTGTDIHGPVDEDDLIALFHSKVLPSSAQIRPVDVEEWYPLESVLDVEEEDNESIPIPPTSLRQAAIKPGEVMYVWGVLFTIAGLCIAGYFAFYYQTSVSVESSYVLGLGRVGGGDVNNLGLMQNRQMGILAGLFLSLIGVILGVAGSMRGKV